MGHTLHKYLSACLVLTSLVGISFSSSPVANAATTSLGPSGVSLTVPGSTFTTLNTALGPTNKIVASNYADRIRIVLSVPSGDGTLQLTTTTNLGSTPPNGYQSPLTAARYEIAFEGPVVDVNSALDGVKFTPTSGINKTVVLSVTSSYVGTGDNGYAYSDNTGHFYRYFSTAKTWQTARNDTDNCAITFNGLCGYLATITSEAENQFVTGKTGTSPAWLGGNDTASEGVWRWPTNSPENGSIFWNGVANGSAPAAAYAKWSANEPNDYSTGEDALQIVTGGSGSWNDLPSTGTTLGYVLEFGGFSNDSPTYASTSRSINLVVDSAAPTVSSFTSNEASPTAPKTLTYSLSFNESISGLSAGDFTNAGTALGCTFTPNSTSGTNFTLTVASCSNGTVIPRLASGSVQDGVGNSGPSSASNGTTITITVACTYSEVTTGGYKFFKFTDVQNCGWLVPENVNSIDLMVVGGGGGGGYDAGSGGGGGGAYIANQVTTTASSTISLRVGAGGSAGIYSPVSNATAGSESSVIIGGDVYRGTGGAAGANGINSSPQPNGAAGGSGSGVGGTAFTGGSGGQGIGWTSTTAGVGQTGGNGQLTSNLSLDGNAFGGGGAGGANVYLATNVSKVDGGIGGGGYAGYKLNGNPVAAMAGDANTGGGGGSGMSNVSPDSFKSGAAGGSGVVILRYALPVEVPSTPDLSASSDSGTSNTDNLTKNTTLTFTGTTMAGSSVTLYAGATATGTCSVSGTSYTCTTGALTQGTYDFTATTTSAGGATSAASSALSVTIKTSAPTFSNPVISSTATNSFYKSGSTISITLTASENVIVGGTPTLTLAIGNNTRTATYVSGSGSTSLVFSYVVATNDSDSDGVALNANSLALTGGSIVDSAGNAADLSHSVIADSSGHKVDGSSPTVSSIASSGTGYYNAGDTITVTIAFSETVTVTGSVRIPVTGVTNGGNDKTVTLEYDNSLSSGDTKVFKYTVVDGDLDLNGIDIAANAIDLNGGSILDAAGNSATITYSAQAPPNTPIIDAVLPTVTVFSADKASGNYKVGETIPISAAISETVNSGAVLTVRLSTGADVALTNASAGTSLTGTYTVSASDSSTVLSVVSFVITTAPTDAAGNALTSTTLPGTNIAFGINIDVDSPLISGPSGSAGADTSAASINENSTAVHTFTANETVSWSVVSAADGGGSDASKFAITSGGALGFATAPNFENPNDAEDSAGNNTYVVKVKAVDAAGNVDTQTVTVSILNVIDTATVTSLTVTSSSGSDNAYTVGETIELTAVFTDAVTLTPGGGTTGYPRIELQGLASKFATYVSGSGTRSLLFRYTVVGGDVDADGFEVLANSIELDTVLVRNSDGQDSNLNHSAISAVIGNKVDALAPLLASTTPSDNATGVALDANITLGFTKAVIKGTGNITIYRTDATPAALFEQIPIGDARITVSPDQLVVTINPTANFSNGVGYYVLVDSTALVDSSGNNFSGVSNANTLNFTAKSNIAITTPSTGLNAYLSLAYSLTVSATLGTGTKEFALDTGTLPAGLTLNSATGVISGTATTAGTSAIKVKVTDGSGTTAVTNSFTITVSTPTFRQFDNGRIRIGSAAGENSVNNKGNFQQPWYKSGSNYFKLTYSSYSLNFAFGSGTANTGYFNGNATPLTQDPAMTGQVLDYSGFVGTALAGTGVRGYGTIISTGTFTLGGVTYRLKNTFVLGETSSSIRITSEFTNTSDSVTGRNLTFWAGTQDDWVGGTDGPTKTKGNLVNGSFVATTSTAAQARALRISSGSEAVLFFSTHPNVNTASNRCCSFTNTTNLNPTTSPITQTGDGSYAMYIPFGDLAPLATSTFTWYYAAGPTAELTTVINNLSQLGSDTTAPTVSGVSIASTSGSDSTYRIGDSIDVNVTFSESVNVTGAPRIPVGGLTGKYFTYLRGSGSSTLTFRYVVATSDLDADGVAIEANALTLNGGNIGDAAGNNAVLTHLALAAQSAHKVDGVVPTISTLTPTDGATGVPVSSNLEIIFSEPITAGTGNIYIKKVISGSGITVEQIPVNGARVTISGSTLVINPDANLESQSSYAIEIDATAVLDAAGNAFAGISNLTTFNFTSANASSPTIVRVTSDYADGTYGALAGSSARTIPIKVVFSKIVNVNISNGKPLLTLATGTSPNAMATYVSGSGTTTLVFDYVVADGHATSDLDYTSVDALTLGTGAVITDAAGNTATLTLPTPGATNSLGANKAIAISTVPPVVSTYLPIVSATNVLADSNIVITFSSQMLIANPAGIMVKKKATPSDINVPITAAVSGNNLTIVPTAALESFSEYYVEISSAALTDLAGNPFAGISANSYSFKSENFTPTAPTISSQPSNVAVTTGRNVSLSVTGTTTDLGVLTYQWYKGSTLITGATSATLTFSPATLADAGDYKVVITNTYRSLTATVESNVATLTVNDLMVVSYGATSIASSYGTTSSSSAPSLTGGTSTKTWAITQTIDSRPLAGITIDSSTGVITVADSLSAGTYEMTVSVTDSTGSVTTRTLSIVVQKKSITISGMSAATKGYDTNTRAVLSFTSANLVGVLSADASGVTINSTSATGAFDTPAVGTGKTVTAAGVALSGPYADNYTVVQPTATANITKGTQAITITSATPAKPLPGRSYTPTATSNSLLAVTFVVDADSALVCEVKAGEVIFLTSGTCRVHFDQAGNDSWEPATRATQALIVGKLGQNITFEALSNKSYGDTAFQVTSTSSSGLLVTFSTDSDASICTVSAIGIVKVNGVGSCRITATQSGSDAYSAATPVSQSFMINPIVPTAPRISSLNPGNEQVTISWTAPQDNGGATITGYRVISQSPDDKICETTGALFCTVSALRNGSPYTFTVTAINSAGSSQSSAQSTAVTPVTKADAVESLILVAGDGELTATWSAPATLGGGSFTKYQLFIKQAIGGSYLATPTAEITDQSVSTYRFTGLTNGTAYTVKVITITTAPIGALEGDTAEVSQIPAVAPDAPRNLVAIAPTGNSATVTWAVPISNGGASITGYTVTATVAGRALTCTAVTATSCFIETITVGTSLRMGKNLKTTGGWAVVDNSLNVSVVANNLIGASAPTSTSVVLPTPPSAPTITKVEAKNGEIQITYTAPTSDGGSAITGYTTTIFKRGSTEIVDTCTSSSLTCGAIVTGNIYDFDYKVIATNPVGAGEVSLIFSPPVPSSGPIVPVTTPKTPVLSGGSIPQVKAGQSVVLAGGVTVESAMKVIDNKTLSISNGSMQLSIKSLNSLGETQSISENMILKVTQAKTAQLEAIGFKPESSVYVWLFSTPILLGEFKINKDGTLNGTIDIPSDTPVGIHTMQINGLGSSDSVVSYTVGVEVLANTVPGVRDLTWKFTDELLNISWSPLEFATTVTVTKPDKTTLVIKVPQGQYKSAVSGLEPGFAYQVQVTPTGLPAGSAYSFTADLAPRTPESVKVYTIDQERIELRWAGSSGAKDYVVSIVEIRTKPELGEPIRTEIFKATQETSLIFSAEPSAEYEVLIYAESATGKQSEVAKLTGVKLADQATPKPPTEPVVKGKRTLSVFMAKGKPSITASERTKVRTIAKSLKSSSAVTCVAYVSNSSTSARKVALTQASFVCKTLKSDNKKITYKLQVLPISKAVKVRLSANPKKTQRVDIFK